MTNAVADYSQELPEETPSQTAAIVAVAQPMVRIPGITIHVFMVSSGTAEEFERVKTDRRLARTQLKGMVGGIKAATNHYRTVTTPNLIVIESHAEGEALLQEIDELAEVCDPSSRVIVIGGSNDIDLYRNLMRRGISEYLLAPIEASALISAIADLFAAPDAAKIGRTYAFIGARGGSGSSTLAHNVASLLGRLSESEVILADLDMPFGTAALDFDLVPERGIADAVREPGRIDDQMLDRLLIDVHPHLKILAAPSTLESTAEMDAESFEAVLDLAQSRAAHIVLDLPHIWSASARRTLVAADEVVITATPDLASLRNTRNLVAMLRQARPHDPDPKLVLNQVGTPRRPEIGPEEFAKAVQLKPLVIVPYDAHAFGTAANSGKLVFELPKGKALKTPLRQIAECLIGRQLGERSRGLSLSRLIRLGMFSRDKGKA